MRAMKGCLGSIGLLLVVVVIAYAGWRYGGAVFPRIEALLGGRASAEVMEGPQPSEAIADAALDRYQTLLRSERGTEESFSGLEVTSMIRFSFPGLLPQGLVDPEVVIHNGTLDLRARVARDRFPSFPHMDGVMEILPDTLPLQVRAVVLPFDPAHLSMMVQGIDATAIPVPRRFIPDILTAVGRRPMTGLPPSAVAVPLPEGLSAAYVDGDRLVLVAEG